MVGGALDVVARRDPRRDGASRAAAGKAVESSESGAVPEENTRDVSRERPAERAVPGVARRQRSAAAAAARRRPSRRGGSPTWRGRRRRSGAVAWGGWEGRAGACERSRGRYLEVFAPRVPRGVGTEKFPRCPCTPGPPSAARMRYCCLRGAQRWHATAAHRRPCRGTCAHPVTWRRHRETQIVVAHEKLHGWRRGRHRCDAVDLPNLEICNLRLARLLGVCACEGCLSRKVDRDRPLLRRGFGLGLVPRRHQLPAGHGGRWHVERLITRPCRRRSKNRPRVGSRSSARSGGEALPPETLERYPPGPVGAGMHAPGPPLRGQSDARKRTLAQAVQRRAQESPAPWISRHLKQDFLLRFVRG